MLPFKQTLTPSNWQTEHFPRYQITKKEPTTSTWRLAHCIYLVRLYFDPGNWIRADFTTCIIAYLYFQCAELWRCGLYIVLLYLDKHFCFNALFSWGRLWQLVPETAREDGSSLSDCAVYWGILGFFSFFFLNLNIKINCLCFKFQLQTILRVVFLSPSIRLWLKLCRPSLHSIILNKKTVLKNFNKAVTAEISNELLVCLILFLFLFVCSLVFICLVVTFLCPGWKAVTMRQGKPKTKILCSFMAFCISIIYVRCVLQV